MYIGLPYFFSCQQWTKMTLTIKRTAVVTGRCLTQGTGGVAKYQMSSLSPRQDVRFIRHLPQLAARYLWEALNCLLPSNQEETKRLGRSCLNNKVGYRVGR